MALGTGRAPDCAGEGEVALADRLRSFCGHHAGPPQRRVRVAEGQADDVRPAAVAPQDERAPGALDGVGSSLVEWLAGRNVGRNGSIVLGSHRHPRADGERERAAGSIDDGDGGNDVVVATRKPGEHRHRVGRVARLAKTLAIQVDLGVRGERGGPALGDLDGLRPGRRRRRSLVDVRLNDREGQVEKPKELPAPG